MHEPLEQAVIERIKELRVSGMTIREIADALEISLGCAAKYAKGVTMNPDAAEVIRLRLVRVAQQNGKRRAA
jgi:orotate phosphoribosyltransferase-like protein